MHTLRTVPVAFALTAAAAAQISIEPLPTRGMMPAFPAGVILSPGGEIQKKAAGLPVTLAPFDTTDSIADYSVQEILTKLPDVTSLAIDAMSSGNDVLPLLHKTSSNEFWISQGNVAGWAVLHLAMEDDPQIGEVADFDDAVMGYYFDNPSFPQQLRNNIYFELLPGDFSGAAIPSSMDIAMGLLEDNRGRLEVGGAPVTNRVYFSLTPTSAQNVYAQLQTLLEHVSRSPYVPPAPSTSYDGATIFVAEFNGQGKCDGVYVCEDWQTLGIDHGSDIDALAVGKAVALTNPPAGFRPLEPSTPVPSTLLYVFSLDAPVAGEELFATAWVNNGQIPVRQQDPLRGNNGEQIVGSGGSLRGRLRGLCSQDPETPTLGGSAFGEPEDLGITVPYLSLSLAARMTGPPSPAPNDQFVLTGVVSGWGGGTPTDSMVCLYLEVVAGPATGFTTNLTPWFRPATADYLVITEQITAPWMGISMDPHAPANMNRCRFWVRQVGANHDEESFRSLIFRSQ